MSIQSAHSLVVKAQRALLQLKDQLVRDGRDGRDVLSPDQIEQILHKMRVQEDNIVYYSSCEQAYSPFTEVA